MGSQYRTGFAEGFIKRATLASERVFIGVAALLVVVTAAATIYWSGAMSGGMVWMKMLNQTWLTAGTDFIGMWLVMMAAMMLPSFLPRLLSYRGAARRSNKPNLGGITALVGTGYFAVWAVIGAAAYPIGASLAAVTMGSMDLARLTPLATGVVLLLAGAYQHTPRKINHREHCRVTPSPDVRSAWRYGLSLGLHCGLCCAGYMAILLVTGVMDLVPMAIIAAGITLERLTPRPALVARLAGVAMLAAGVFVVVRALAIP